MTITIFDKFNKAFDVENLREDLKNVGSEESFREVPVGSLYDVVISKLQLVESKAGKPMLTCWMKITTGEYENSVLFMNQVINTGYGLHKANEFLRSLESEVEVKFENFKQYNDMILNIHEEIDGVYEYCVEYDEKKGFKTFEIINVYEVE